MKVFIAGYDVMGKSMAGPGMRSLQIAIFLSKYADVTLSFDESSEIDIGDREILLIKDSSVTWESESFWKNFDAAILPGSQTLKTTLPIKFPIPLIVDIYDPYILENIYLLADKQPSIREYEYLRHLKALIEILIKSDRFIVTSDRTRDFFTGFLSAWGILNPLSAKGENFRDYFLTVPFGHPDNSFSEELRNSNAKIQADITDDDDLILWAGGLWDWLDPISLIDAMPKVVSQIPAAKLLFMGYKHPNRHVPIMETAIASIDRAKKLKLFDKNIFFNEWTPFKDRIPLLGKSKLGVSLHKDHIETRYSFRTRLMDYIWAGIPMVLSGGDVLSDELASNGLAEIYENGNIENLSQAIIRMLNKSKDSSEHKKRDSAFTSIREKYRWSNVLKPLAEEIQDIQKIESGSYTEIFNELLGHFPTPSKPGFIDKGIQKIKDRMK